MCSRRQGFRCGFTLVEIMIVIVIIGMLAGMVAMNVRSHMIQAKQNIARADIAKIAEAVDHFYATYSRYPTNEEGLLILARSSDKIPSPLLQGNLTDPWGHPYQYNCPGNNCLYEVISYGEDGREGGEGVDADICHQAPRE